MIISQKGIDLIKKFEKLALTSYKCSAGKDTIGYGHVLNDNKNIPKSIKKETAEHLFNHDIIVFEAYLKSVVKVKLTQGMYDALVSLIFNWGCGKFGRSKGLQMLNKKKLTNAAIEFFSKEKGVVNVNGKFSNGLYRRRQAELVLWRS